MNVNQKLEVLRKLTCLGMNDIEDLFGNDSFGQHLQNKYTECRENHRQYGNLAFLLQLDEENAQKVLDRIGF